VIPRFILQLEAGRAPVVYGDGTQTRDFTYVDDTVSGLVAAGECDALVGDVVNLARGREASILRVAELLSGLTGREGCAPQREARRPGDVQRHCADVAKARRLFGFAPRVELEEGLARTLAWFRANGIAARADAQAAGAPNW
jgi:UDP-glucose 4-epimerase